MRPQLLRGVDQRERRNRFFISAYLKKHCTMKKEEDNVPVENTSTNQQVAQQSSSGATTNQRKYDYHSRRRTPAGEATYCLTLGEGEIYGVTRLQLEQLYRAMRLFIEREKAPFAQAAEDNGVSDIAIGKGVEIYAGGGGQFSVNYGLTTGGFGLRGLSAVQMKRVEERILEFLRVFGENGERRVRWDAADYVALGLPDVPFAIREDARQAAFQDAPFVTKFIDREENEDTEIAFQIEVNEMYLPDLSFAEFLAVYRHLGVALGKVEAGSLLSSSYINS